MRLLEKAKGGLDGITAQFNSGCLKLPKDWVIK